MTKNCIDTKNHEGKHTVFTEKQRVEKAKKHPELREDHFIARVKKTIEIPDFIYEDLDKKSHLSYYCREYKINSRVCYTKVVLKDIKRYYFVITAYRPDYVKERGKTKLIYGKDND
jgi:hypothetical protein